MCVNPGKLANGQTFACRKCEQCRDHYIEDWVGRCIAESKVAVAVNTVTLTYGDERWYDGRDIPHDQKAEAALLTYADVQRYLKRLRNNGYPAKYFCVGEYGDEKGRAHWHIILFWEKRVPAHALRKRFHEPHWPHGVSYWDGHDPSGVDDMSLAKAIKYVCKYLAKGLTPEDLRKQGKLTMSKKPPLGHYYFELEAQKYVDAKLAPQHLFYRFPEIRRGNGRMVQFMLSRASARDFLDAYVMRWYAAYGDELMPASELVQVYLDKLIPEPEFRKPGYRHPQMRPWFTPDWVAPGDTDIAFDDKLNAFYVIRDKKKLFWSFDENGRRAWLDVIRTEPREALSDVRPKGYNEYLARKEGRHWSTTRSEKPKGLH